MSSLEARRTSTIVIGPVGHSNTRRIKVVSAMSESVVKTEAGADGSMTHGSIANRIIITRAGLVNIDDSCALLHTCRLDAN